MTPLPASIGPIHALDALDEVDRRLLELLDSMTGEEWDRPTIVRGWRVRHVAGHLLDTALRRLSTVRDGFAADQPSSGSPDDLRAFVDRLNAEGVAVYGRLSPRVLAAQMREAVAALHAHLRSLDPMAPAVFAVSWAGESESPNWFDIARELTERWHHQQQIRLALDRPDIMEPVLYHPVLDGFMRALPHRYRDVASPVGAHIEVHVTGRGGGTWRLYRAAGSWMLTADALHDPSARIAMPGDIAWRLFTKSLEPAEAEALVTMDGDYALAAHLLGTVAIVG